jgi:hypothetical protein
MQANRVEKRRIPRPEDTIAMPRPTVAQLAYGSCTVIFSTLAMLLLSQARSVPGIAVVTVVALALGLIVAMTVRRPKPASRATRPTTQAETAPERERLAA